jgi:lipopolysaccharide export system ATP-binding protein
VSPPAGFAAPLPDDALPAAVRRALANVATGDRSAALTLHAVVATADAHGAAPFDDMARRYRADHLEALRHDGGDVEREAGRLSLDEVRQHLLASVLPRLAGQGLVVLEGGIDGGAPGVVRMGDTLWREVAPQRERVAHAFLVTGEHHATAAAPEGAHAPSAHGSVLAAEGLVKTYKQRSVVNDVALNLQQGEIVGLLGPNGAGKTTTFYMIVGLIAPNLGRITLDGEDITDMPMYRRARRGIGYLSQEPSIFASSRSRRTSSRSSRRSPSAVRSARHGWRSCSTS